MQRRILSILLTLALSFGLLALAPVTASAAGTYTITFDANGGNMSPTNPIVKTVTEGDSVSGPSASKTYTLTYNTGGSVDPPASKIVTFTCAHWNTAANGSGERRVYPNTTYTPTQSETLYARWVNPAMGELPTRTRAGYTLTGWFTAATGGTQVTSATELTGNTTIYARWAPATYTVTLSQGGGTGGTTSVTATYGEPMPTPIELPTWKYHLFKGYGLWDDGARKIYYTAEGASAANWDRTASTTLYAYWEQTPYPWRTITVVGGVAGSEETVMDQIVTIRANVPSRNVFVKWTTDSPGVTFADERSPETTFVMPDNDVTVTATFQGGILGTHGRYQGWWAYLLFFLCFGFIWMWF